MIPETPRCKVCGSQTRLFDIVDFNKHCGTEPYQFGAADIAVSYYRCHQCDFTFTDLIDDWSPSEISELIYNDDYIKVDPEYLEARPLRTAIAMAERLRGCEDLRILDYGSGTGKFADELARRGYGRVENYDPFSSPARPVGKFDMIIMSEVIEHVPDPLETLKAVSELLSPSGAILVGEALQPDNINELRGRWWYLGPRNGHVSTFSERTFLIMASALGLRYHRGPGLYCFTRPNLDASVAHALAGFTVPVHLLSLRGTEKTEACWHEREKLGNQTFRWSRTLEVIWSNVAFSSGITVVVIPVLMEVRQGFAQQSRVIVDRQPVASSFIQGRGIWAEMNLPAGNHQVCLVTPEPVSPKSLRGSPDERLLGLAIPSTD
jgi:2-polyprenyl-6-hydroxyphenyl methylase/3-demethylubiquinone-9 3-methyltransferase